MICYDIWVDAWYDDMIIYDIVQKAVRDHQSKWDDEDKVKRWYWGDDDDDYDDVDYDDDDYDGDDDDYYVLLSE
jgi:hypothetical protein